MAPQRRGVALLALFLGGAVVLPLVSPQIVRSFIDRATGGAATGALLGLAGGYMAVAVLRQVANLGTNYMSQHVGWTATNLLRSDLARHAVGLDMSFHNRHTPGEMIERVDGDVTALANFLSSFVMNVVWAVLLLAGILVMMIREDARVGLAMAAFTALAALVVVRLRSVAVPAFTAQREKSAGLFGFLEERLAGIDDIRSLGAGDHVMRGFHAAGREVYEAGMRGERMGMAMWTSTSGLFVLGNVLALGMGAWLYSRGEATIGAVYLLFQYMHMVQEPLEILAEQLRDFQKAGAGAARVHELLGQSPAIVDGPGDEIPSGPLALRFDNVSFAYHGGRGGGAAPPDAETPAGQRRTPRSDEPAVDLVSFAVEPGAVLGVLGRTGSGKTTLARLALRLYDPGTGTISLGGVDLRRARLDDLRHRVGYVTQDVQLFRAPVRDNVTLFTPGHDDGRIVEVLNDLGLGAWLSALPDGLDTELEGGLSAGEAQLLAFARVFLRDPGLVILDEASSRLDPATERRIESAMDRLLRNRTGMLIAHRLSTVARADAILIVEDGRVAEWGPRAALAADPSSRFASLLRTSLEEVLA